MSLFYKHFDFKGGNASLWCMCMVQWKGVMFLLEMATREHNKGCKHIGPIFVVKQFFYKELEERYT
jgi:hypothetical protein